MRRVRLAGVNILYLLKREFFCCRTDAVDPAVVICFGPLSIVTLVLWLMLLTIAASKEVWTSLP